MSAQLDDPNVCNCCGNEPSVGVASSGLAAMSIAWGRECLRQGAEPLWIVYMLVDMNGGLDGCNDMFKELMTYKDGQYLNVADACRDYVPDVAWLQDYERAERAAWEKDQRGDAE